MKANGIATEIDTSYGVMENCIREKDRERKSYDLGLGMEDNSTKLMYSIG